MSRGTKLLPEGGRAGAGLPSHTEHAQALGEQHKGQQDPVQEGLMGREEDKRQALLGDSQKEVPIHAHPEDTGS